ncbi:MAG: hypothetical protein WCO23_04415 [bacterium]
MQEETVDLQNQIFPPPVVWATAVTAEIIDRYGVGEVKKWCNAIAAIVHEASIVVGIQCHHKSVDHALSWGAIMGNLELHGFLPEEIHRFRLLLEGNKLSDLVKYYPSTMDDSKHMYQFMLPNSD